ncbi:MAG: hypothetical protein AAGK02_05510 [Pseudomonadota bacterium]
MPLRYSAFAVSAIFFATSPALAEDAVESGHRVHELKVGSFSVTPDTVRGQPVTEVNLVLVIEPGNVRHYRMDRRVTVRHESATTHSYADSRSCPAMMDELAKVEDLVLPRFTAPGSHRTARAPILLHPTRYTLEMRAFEDDTNTGAHVTLDATSGSSLAKWTQNTLQALVPCWIDEQV